jgi:hypothetical protein
MDVVLYGECLFHKNSGSSPAHPFLTSGLLRLHNWLYLLSYPPQNPRAHMVSPSNPPPLHAIAAFIIVDIVPLFDTTQKKMSDLEVAASILTYLLK